MWELLAPTFYLERFAYSKSGFSVIEYLMCELLLTMLPVVVVTFFSVMISSFFRKNAITVFISSTLVCVIYACEIYYDEVVRRGFNTGELNIVSPYAFTKIYGFFKVVSPFSLLNVKYYFEQPRNFSIGIFTFEIWIVPALLCLLFIGILILFIYKLNSFPKRSLNEI